jgi:hypothetical protein
MYLYLADNKYIMFFCMRFLLKLFIYFDIIIFEGV